MASRPIPTAAAASAADHPSGDERFNLLDAAMKRHRFALDALIEVLHVAQKVFGYLEPGILNYVAHALKLPPSRVYGVATFYHLFSFVPKGRHTCIVCTGTACYVQGAGRLLAAVQKGIGISPGETTLDHQVTTTDRTAWAHAAAGAWSSITTAKSRPTRHPRAAGDAERMDCRWTSPRPVWGSCRAAAEALGQKAGANSLLPGVRLPPLRVDEGKRIARKGSRRIRPGRSGRCWRRCRLHAALLRGPAGAGRPRGPAPDERACNPKMRLRSWPRVPAVLNRRHPRGDPHQPFFARQMGRWSSRTRV